MGEFAFVCLCVCMGMCACMWFQFRWLGNQIVDVDLCKDLYGYVCITVSLYICFVTVDVCVCACVFTIRVMRHVYANGLIATSIHPAFQTPPTDATIKMMETSPTVTTTAGATIAEDNENNEKIAHYNTLLKTQIQSYTGNFLNKDKFGIIISAVNDPG